MYKLPPSVPSKYQFVLIAAERAKQLQQGGAPLVKTSHVKPTYRAIDELMHEKLEFEIRESPEPKYAETLNPDEASS